MSSSPIQLKLFKHPSLCKCGPMIRTTDPLKVIDTLPLEAMYDGQKGYMFLSHPTTNVYFSSSRVVQQVL